MHGRTYLFLCVYVYVNVYVRMLVLGGGAVTCVHAHTFVAYGRPVPILVGCVLLWDGRAVVGRIAARRGSRSGLWLGASGTTRHFGLFASETQVSTCAPPLVSFSASVVPRPTRARVAPSAAPSVGVTRWAGAGAKRRRYQPRAVV